MSDTELDREPVEIESEPREPDLLAPERYERGDVVTLRYYSLRHQTTVNRRGIVWESRPEDNETVISVEHFGSKGTRRNEAWTVHVLRDGTIENKEKRSGSLTRVKMGEEASLFPGWN